MRILAALLTAAPSALGALTLTPGAAWRGPDIPVCWENPTVGERQERDMIRKSLSWTWERESAVRFTGWRACGPEGGGVRISLESSHPSTAARGEALAGVPRGVRLPSLWSLAALSVNLKAPAHEFGHVLGFGHEYARADAPELDRCGLKRPDGAVYLEEDEALTPFDPASIMVACVAGATTDFSRGLPKLSALDIFGLVRVYGSNPNNVLDEDEPGDRFGAALLLQDFNGDGAPDLAVGAPGEDDGAGAVYLYRGDPVSGFRPWARLVPGEADGPGFGAALAAGDDGALWAGAAAGFVLRGDKWTRDPEAAGAPRAAEPQEAVMEIAPAPGFPDAPGGPAVLADADLDGDGVAERTVGVPGGDARAPGSGVVVVMRRGRAGAFEPWYWFGQAY